MASKQDILNNLREFTSDQIAEAIKAGTVTLYELSKSGNLTPLMRRRIEAKLAEDSSGSDFDRTAAVSSPADSITHTEVVDVSKADETDELPESYAPNPCIVTATAQPTFGGGSEGRTNEDFDGRKNGMFKRPFSFKGRIRRMEYGISVIIYIVWYCIVTMLLEAPDSVAVWAVVFVLISIVPMIWFLWAQNCKRCHDIGDSGFYQLLPFYFLLLLFKEGDDCTNEYGDNPKE